MALALCLLTGACGVPVAVSAASYAADGGLVAASDKTSTDHLISVVTKEDCAIWRIFRGRRVCTERADGEDPYDVDYGEPQRQVSEDGVQYAPPLRAPPDVPPASWDAAAYKPAEPEPAVAEPMAAARPAASVPAPATPQASVAPAKAKKMKSPQRAVRKQKPSRGRAAPAS